MAWTGFGVNGSFTVAQQPCGAIGVVLDFQNMNAVATQIIGNEIFAVGRGGAEMNVAALLAW